jgi:HEAT repeat protein
MRKHDPQLQEDGFHLLLPHAAAHVDELMADFQEETQPGLRRWFLELIGAARSPRAFSLLVEQLKSSDDSLRSWAAHGLRDLNTPDARQALFDAGVQKSRRD